jgi:hypothetical protein
LRRHDGADRFLLFSQRDKILLVEDFDFDAYNTVSWINGLHKDVPAYVSGVDQLALKLWPMA